MLKPVCNNSLNSRQQKNYNFAKIAVQFAEYYEELPEERVPDTLKELVSLAYQSRNKNQE